MISFNEYLTERTKWIQKADLEKGAFTDYCGGKVTNKCITFIYNFSSKMYKKDENITI